MGSDLGEEDVRSLNIHYWSPRCGSLSASPEFQNLLLRRDQQPG